MSPPRRRVLLGIVLLALLGSESSCSRPTLPPEPTPEVTITAARTEDVPIYGEWVGTTQGYINAQIRPKVEGYLLKQNYPNGGAVKAGEPMFEIDPRQFIAELNQAQGQLSRAQAALGRSQLDVKRYTPLAKSGAVSQKELDDAIQQNLGNEAEVASAQAAVQQAQLNLGWTKIVSPIDGVAGIAVAQVGDLIGPTVQLTQVSQIDPMKVSFPISEQQYLAFERHRVDRKGDRRGAQMTLADGTVYPVLGELYAVGLEVDPTTGTILIEVTFPNKKGLLRPGLYASIRVELHKLDDAVVVPQKAVSDLQGTYQLAVVGKDDVVTMRTVEVGPTYKELWVISKGLAVGENVVVEGLQFVKTGTKVIAKAAKQSTPDPQPTATEPAAHS